MERVAVWTLNGALFALSCFLLASTLARVIEAAVTPAPAPLAEPAQVPRSSSQASWNDRQIILQRNLFASVASGNESANGTDAEQRFAETKLPLELIGTIAAEQPEASIAAVMDKQKKEAVVVRQGDTIAGSAKVQRIERRRIVLLNGGQLEELTLNEDQPSSLAPTPTRTPSRRPAPRRRAFGRTIPGLGQKLDEIRKNPAPLLSQVDAQPRYEDGQMVGIAIGRITPGSDIERAGLQTGDLITEFNGIPINNPQQSMALLNEFNSATSIDLKVTGADGEEKTLHIEGNQ